MFHPKPEMLQSKQQLQSAFRCFMMESKKWSVMGNSERLPQKVEILLKGSGHNPCRKD